jgi:hypothetical protein
MIKLATDRHKLQKPVERKGSFSTSSSSAISAVEKYHSGMNIFALYCKI